MCVCVCVHMRVSECILSCVQLFVTPWTVAHQALLSMGFPRQEYWSGPPLPPLADLPDPGMERESPACLSCDCRHILYHCATWEALEGFNMSPKAGAGSLP